MFTKCRDGIPKQKVEDAWSKGKIISYKGRKYTVHKMSYGQFFLEPKGKVRGEREKFKGDEVWLEVNPENKSCLK
jgi:hypothetical protein